MNTRERFNAALNFKPVDRLPIVEWAPWWRDTFLRWKEEGLPEHLFGTDIQEYLGLDVMHDMYFLPTSPNTPKPAHHGAAIFTDLNDYEKNVRPTLFKFDPDSIHSKFKDPYWVKRIKNHEDGKCILRFVFEGFFWFPRTVLGIEPHLFAFYDQPELMKEMNQQNAEWMVKSLDAICENCQPDFMTFAEDMSYNHGPMISKDLYDEFMDPYYKIVIPELKKRNIKVIIDSDGDIHEAAAWFKSSGIEGILPLERQAGVDISKLREDYPDQIYIGAYDKMVMDKGEAAMRKEFERLIPVAKKGGFIISCDHQTPPSVSLENYKLYLKLFNEYAQM